MQCHSDNQNAFYSHTALTDYFPTVTDCVLCGIRNKSEICCTLILVQNIYCHSNYWVTKMLFTIVKINDNGDSYIL
jgi:hypothetical protein